MHVHYRVDWLRAIRCRTVQGSELVQHLLFPGRGVQAVKGTLAIAAKIAAAAAGGAVKRAVDVDEIREWIAAVGNVVKGVDNAFVASVDPDAEDGAAEVLRRRAAEIGGAVEGAADIKQ